MNNLHDHGSLRPSPYLIVGYEKDGSLNVYDSYSRNFGAIEPQHADAARRALQVTSPGIPENLPEDLRRQMVNAGFLIQAADDSKGALKERSAARFRQDSLRLIVIPTESCNFRCVYCYEDHVDNRMSEETQNLIVDFVQRRNPRRLELSWFGGEPFETDDIVFSLTRRLRDWASQSGSTMRAAATTNGWHLDQETIDQCLSLGLDFFQITLDGLAETHDVQRPHVSGGPTFAHILDNLRKLKQRDESFRVALRHNYSPDTVTHADDFLDYLETEFGDDPRFTIDISPVGCWGGENDGNFEVFEERKDIYEQFMSLRKKAHSRGFADSVTRHELFSELGCACYASDPNCFVVGVKGELYKCTVLLGSNEINVVGQLLDGGRADIDWAKLAKWTHGSVEAHSTKCDKCPMMANCLGLVCPKEVLLGTTPLCPPARYSPQQHLSLIRRERERENNRENLEVNPHGNDHVA